MTVDFSPGITAIVGGNGAGKTRILGSIAGALGSDSEPAQEIPEPPPWLQSIEILGVDSNQQAWKVSDTDAGSTSCPVSVHYLNVSRQTELAISAVHSDSNPTDFIDGIDPIDFTDEERAVASFLIGRNYSDISVFEITDFSPEDDPIPYIRVSSGTVEYGVEAMGRGEFSALFLLWKFRTLESNSIILLEEPETHLATRSQGPLLDYLAFCAVKRRIQIVLSTHSPSIVLNLPTGHAIRCASLPTPIVDTTLHSRDLARHLGLSSESRILVVTEDPAASALASEIFACHAGEVAHRIDVVFHRDGESAVRRFVSGCGSLEATGGPVVAALLDGDQRSSADSGEYWFLPSTVSPEQLCRNAFAAWWSSSDREDLHIPNVPSPRLLMILDELMGLEDHDWLREVSLKLGGMSVVMGVALEMLRVDAQVQQHITDLISSVREYLGR